MSRVFSSLGLALMHCLHPRIILWSFLPLLLAGGALGALGVFGWESAVDGVRGLLERFDLIASALQWLDSVGARPLRSLLAPMIVVALAVPVVVVVTLLLVGVLLTPVAVDVVARSRFPALERKEGAAWWQGVAWSLLCTAAAVLALLVSIPLWLVPPLAILVPPLVWGWLTYRVFAFDVLASHASAEERRTVLRQRRWPLLAIGVVCGLLGAAPSLVWALGAAWLIFAPLLVVVAVWLYTMVFAFAALWFAHYGLGELQTLRVAGPAPVPLAIPEAKA